MVDASRVLKLKLIRDSLVIIQKVIQPKLYLADTVESIFFSAKLIE